MTLGKSKVSTTVAYSSYAASYAEAGWNEAGVKFESPWASGNVGGGSSSSASKSEDSSRMYVIGRWSYHMCRLSLPKIKLEPHPGLKEAVDDALKMDSIEDRREQLRRVFDEWGYHFLASVEMGGTKFGKHDKLTSGYVRHEPLKSARLLDLTSS
jgi:hypothetical protein